MTVSGAAVTTDFCHGMTTSNFEHLWDVSGGRRHGAPGGGVLRGYVESQEGEGMLFIYSSSLVTCSVFFLPLPPLTRHARPAAFTFAPERNKQSHFSAHPPTPFIPSSSSYTHVEVSSNELRRCRSLHLSSDFRNSISILGNLKILSTTLSP